MTASLDTLIAVQTKEQIYSIALGIAQALGLPVTSWQAGDPTRSLYHLEAELLASLETLVASYIRSGFLSYAAELAEASPEDEQATTWLKILAEQVYNVSVPSATFATTSVTLTNTGGGYFVIESGDLTFKNAVTGKTYRNTTGGTLNPGPGTTLVVDVVADEAGAASNAAAGEITELVTTLLGVTCTNATVAVGIDEQAPSVTVQQCRDKLDALSPNGPKGAYAYVARNAELAGTSAVTRVRTFPDSLTGEVTIYVAGPAGAVSSPDLALVEAAILEYATPLCITPAVLSAANVTTAVTYNVWIYQSSNKTEDEVKDAIDDALTDLFASRPIGGDIIPPATTGKLYTSVIEATIRSTFPEIFRVELTLPAADVALTNSQVAAKGTVTGTVNIVADPR